MMKLWSISEARAHISEVFESALKDGPQKIERRDRKSVVVVSEATWSRLQADYPSFADLVLNSGLEEDDLPKRLPARVLGSL
ncbi:type II toxin-antitoxin system Phd/YefM family antitoxin [Oryzicola mucosus]|uniref:Antitoxin n=1 Tax=Oryzicola mucosus TaxID=2767425 RepID=A0A8J6PKZ7_9HYPH|nr:type II toxin-antitoxin system Phd/YefM family antitoxin [Oryzicola mucosus]MBD0416358.1 type II toxin-antitoxin system Phd/YefM family antitoxin [Oryzicola mucosus]